MTSHRPRPHWVAIGVNLVVAAGLVGWLVWLRPLAFGGPATYLVIHGNSMYPTYREGDLVVTRRQVSYGVGQVVAYRVPEGQVGSGHVVIHRIARGSDSGFVMKGDHNQFEDPWRPKAADIVGSSWIAVSSVGWMLVVVRQPIVAATIAALVVALYLSGRARRRSPATQ